jgi:adenylate kinase
MAAGQHGSRWMRAIVTGQVGVDKKQYLQAVEQLAADRGDRLATHHVGDRMYAEASDVRPGRILDLPLSRLHQLRRSVFRDIIAASHDQTHVIVNTHATFRWRHGLFRAFDFDQIEQLRPDLFVCLVDNAEAIYHRLHRDHTLDATLKDIMVWREEEIMATELLAQAVGCGNRFFVMARGREKLTTQSMYRLVCRPKVRRVYPSFPMSHVVDMPDVLAEINAFRQALAEHFIAFDPGDVDEKLLLENAIRAAREGHDFIECTARYNGRDESFNLPVKQVLDCAGDVDGQIYARDFKLIDQSDMICSLVPELPGGVPGLSSGVERELQHAFEASKDVYVVWKPAKSPSPFITETATRVFSSVDEALDHFDHAGLFTPDQNLFGK